MAKNTLKLSHGLIIGKFMPPHAGHKYLIDFARAQVDYLTVILFTKSFDPIPGYLRVEWLREIASDAQIVHITDEHPSDFQDDQIWNLWVQSIRQVYTEQPDIVFSSEKYGEELARRLGARHVLVDQERRHVSISSTRVRERPLACWEFLSQGVRAYYAKRVCILGAESTGKTTLAAALAHYYRTPWVPEYAREYLEATKQPCQLSDMVPIAEGQIKLEDALARQANRLLVCDTNLITTMIWSEHYWGFVPKRIRQLIEGRTYDLYFVTNIDIPWIADSLRDSPNYREWFHERYLRELRTRSANYFVLAGTHEKRMTEACKVIDQLISNCSAC